MLGTALLGNLPSTALAMVAGCGSPDTCLIQLVLQIVRCLLNC